MTIGHSLAKLSIGILCATCAWSQQYTISTIAGTNVQGFSGDSGAPTSAQLALPGRIALDSSGKIYIADGFNNRVRMISSGTITTVAGTGTAGFSGDGKAATAAQLTDPIGVAVDSSGNLYIADAGNNVIRKVTSSGTISTIAGNNTAGYSGDTGDPTKAQLNDPVAVAVDAAGNVYIADTLHNRIRKVSSSGIITTIAGQGDAFYGGDGGPAINAKLFFPHDVAIDSSGNVYVADTSNNVIRLLVPQNPVLSANGVVNGANFLSRNISAGALATVFGVNFASGPVTASQLPLPAILGPVSVT